MNLVVRRRLAVGALATAAAVAVSGLAAPAAFAGAISKVDPNNGFNNNNSLVVTLTTTGAFRPSDPLTGQSGSVVDLTRVGTTTDIVEAPVDPSDPTHPKATFNLQDTGTKAEDGPANPGSYNVDITDQGTGQHDSCQQCFQVFSSGTLGLTDLSPNSLAAGGSTNVTFNGSAFARGTKIEFLLADGTVDPAITVGAPTQPGTPASCAAAAQPPGCTLEIATRTTNTTMLRRVTIDAKDVAGPRGVRVTNTDGATASCTACFTVNGAPFTSVTPNAANNATSAPTVRVTFTGPSVPQSGVPQLVFAGTAGSSTQTDLTLTGTNVTYAPTSVSADFDFRNAAPGSDAYIPTLTQADGSANACGCRFSVGQATPASVTTLTPNTAAQSDSRTVTIDGKNLSRGVQIIFSGTGIDVTSVSVNAAGTQAQATIRVQSTATAGKRDVTAKTTDGITGPICSGCFTVTASSSTASPSSSACPSGSPSSSPTASTSPTASSSASANSSSSPTASASATSTATTSPSGSPSSSSCPSNRQAATLTTERSTINAGESVNLLATGQANQQYSLQCYTRPSTSYTEARSGSFNDAGDPVTFTLSLGRNTRCFLRYVTNPMQDASSSIVVNVKTVLSLSTVRQGVRKYLFQGRNLPRVAGQLITLYRVDNTGREIRTSNLVTDDSGIYRVSRTFTGTGTFRFKVRTSQTNNNAAGVSNTITVRVF